MKLAVLLAFVLIQGCASTEKNNTRADAYLQIGTAHLMKGNYPLALSNLMESVRLNPNNELAQNNLGLAYYVRKKFPQALEHINKAIELNPKYTDARNNRGRLYADIGKYDAAIADLTRAKNDLTYTQPGKVISNLGYAYFKKGDFKKAQLTLAEAVRVNRDCFSFNYYGRSIYGLKNYKLAAEVLDEAIRLCASARFDEPHFFSGMSYYELNQREQAEARFDEILKLYPDSQYAKRAKKMLEAMQ
jgi:type IV pilus assembly protein PilF